MIHEFQFEHRGQWHVAQAVMWADTRIDPHADPYIDRIEIIPGDGSKPVVLEEGDDLYPAAKAALKARKGRIDAEWQQFMADEEREYEPEVV